MDHFSGTLTRHPVLACADVIEGALKEARDVSPAFMRTDEKREALLKLTKLQEQMSGLTMAIIAEAGDVAEGDGSRSVASWLANQTNADTGTWIAAQRLAEELSGHYELAADALRDGRLSVRQAEVIVRSLNSLGPDVRPELRRQAEAYLVQEAQELRPKELRRVGDAILERLDPETYDDAERKKLEAALRRAQADTRLNIRNRGDGSTQISMRVPEGAAARLKTLLDAFTSPRHDSVDGQRLIDPATGKRLTGERARGEAFLALLEAISADALPMHGGSSTTVIVTIDLDSLMNGTGCGTLSDGTRLPAGEVRRLACKSGMIPAVLGGDSQVLDLGRAQRLFSPAQRKALAINQPTCRAFGCDVPATWCEAHHLDPWSRGGRTDLDKGVLLCSHHHHRIHDESYLHKRMPDGRFRFNRRR